MKKLLAVTLAVALLPLLPLVAIAETAFSQDVAAINEAAKSVLLLEVYDIYGDLTGTGSGFVAFESDILVTNYHVIEDSEKILAYSDEGYSYVVDKVYAADESADIAILGFSEPTDRTPLSLGEGAEIQRAEAVVAIGSPKGMLNTVSMGNVSAFFEEYGIQLIQFTAPISSGSSGGALFNNRGEVIGVTSASYDDGEGVIQNLNFAVNIEEVKRLHDGIDRNASVSLAAFCQGARPGSSSAGAHSGKEASSGALGTVLVDQGGVRLEITQVSYDSSFPLLRFDVQVQNSTGKTISISFNDALADGQSVRGVGIYNLEDGASISEYFFFTPYGDDPDVLETVKSLSFTLTVQESSTLQTLWEAPLSLSAPFVGEAASEPASQSGRYVLIDQGGVYLEVEAGYYEPSYPLICFEGTVRNASGRKIDIFVRDSFADGVETSAGGIFGVEDGASIPEYFFVCPFDKTDTFLSSAQTLSLTLAVKDSDTYDFLFEIPLTFVRSGSVYVPEGTASPETPSPQTSISVTEEENYVLIDQGGVYLEAEPGRFEESFPLIRFESFVSNSSGRKIDIYISDVFVDGVKHGGGGIFGVEDGASIPEYFFVCPDAGYGGSDQYLRSAQRITCVLDVSDSDTMRTLFEIPLTFVRSGSVYIPAGAASAQATQATFDFSRNMVGATLIDQGGVRMWVTSYRYAASYPSLDFHVDVVNGIGREINILIQDAQADGCEIKGYGAFFLDGGQSSEILFFQELSGGASSLPSAREISFTFAIQDAATYETLFEVPVAFYGPFRDSDGF